MQIGKYTLGREIGRGGMGTVYESFHPQLARPVAIKLIQSSDADSRIYFIREAQMVASLSHPNIVNIFDVDEHQGQPFLVMELFQRSLADRIGQGPLPPAEVLQIGRKLADALGYAHDQAIIHRDLKPANVLLRQDETPVLADFGLARVIAAPASPSASGVLLGTPAYMAPEQFRYQPATIYTDLYALGVLLYEALTGRVPFDGDTAAIIRGHVQGSVPALHSLAADIPPALEDLVLKLLNKDPLQRPANAAEVAKALMHIQQTLAPTPSAAVNPGSGAVTGPTITIPHAHVSTATSANSGQAQHIHQQARPASAPVRPRTFFILGLITIGVVIALALLQSLLVTPIISGSSTPISGQIATVQSVRRTARPTSELTKLTLRELSQAKMTNPRPTANTSEFRYAGVTWEDTANSIIFYGELRNESQIPHENVRVQITLLNSAGQALSTTNAQIERSVLKPGETSPFYVLFFEQEVPQVKFSDYKVEILSKPAESFALNYYIYDGLRVEVSDVGQNTFGNIPVVRGNFYNDRDTALNFPEIVAVFYNEAGDVIGVSSCYAKSPDGTNTLAAHSSAPFETIFFTPTQRGATAYMLYVEGRTKA